MMQNAIKWIFFVGHNVIAAAHNVNEKKLCRIWNPDTIKRIRSPNPVPINFCCSLSLIFLKKFPESRFFIYNIRSKAKGQTLLTKINARYKTDQINNIIEVHRVELEMKIKEIMFFKRMIERQTLQNNLKCFMID